jgi:hypothetical protein
MFSSGHRRGPGLAPIWPGPMGFGLEGTVEKRDPFTEDDPFVLFVAVAGVAVLVISLIVSWALPSL